MTYISIKAHVYVAHSMEFLHDNFNHLLPIGLGGGGYSSIQNPHSCLEENI